MACDAHRKPIGRPENGGDHPRARPLKTPGNWTPKSACTLLPLSVSDAADVRLSPRGSTALGAGLASTVSQGATDTPPRCQLLLLWQLGYGVSGRFDPKFADELFLRQSAAAQSDRATPLDRY